MSACSSASCGPRLLAREIALRFLFYCIIGGFVDAVLLLAGAQKPIKWLLFPFVGAWIVTASGEIVLRFFGLRLTNGWLPAAFVTGLSITSIVMTIPTLFWDWSAQSAFLAWTPLVLSGVTLGRRLPGCSPSVAPADVATTFGFAVCVAYFARHQILSLSVLQHTGTLPAWIDYIIHGTLIASFGDPLANGVGDIMVPGVGRVFYHYASFMLPAALVQVTGLPGLGLATAVLLPLGLLAGLCGLYVLGLELGGVRLGLLAVWLAVCLPDASQYGFHNGYFSFHWLLFATAGTGYAIGLAAVASTCALRWIDERQLALLLLTALLTLLLIFVRAHMFILLAPALAGTMVLALLPARMRPWIVVAAGIAGTALTVLLIAGFFGQYGEDWSRPWDYLMTALRFGPASLIDFMQHLNEQYGKAAATLIGGVLLLPTTLGLWAFIFPAVAIWQARRGRFGPADYLPLLLCLTYGALVFWAPIAFNGDLTEYKHRHFVLLYAVVLVWTISRLASLAGLGSLLARLNPRAAAGLAAAVCAATVFIYRHVDPARPAATLSRLYAARVELGVPEAASYLRVHARVGDVIAIGGTGAYPPWGVAVELSSLTDMPIYVGRIDLQMATRNPEVRKIVAERAARIAAADANPDRLSVLAALRSYGIRWYVTVAPELPAWDRDGSMAEYHVGSTFVYDTHGSAEAPAKREGP